MYRVRTTSKELTSPGDDEKYISDDKEDVPPYEMK